MLRTLILQYTKYMTSEQYVTISQKLVAKYPNLRDRVGTNGYVSAIVVHALLLWLLWCIGILEGGFAKFIQKL